MDDLDRSTNRLRRKFDPTSNYLETKVQMEQVMDSARRVNQVMTKGNYGKIRINCLDTRRTDETSWCQVCRPTGS